MSTRSPREPDSASVSDSDDYSVYTKTTTSENVIAQLEEGPDSFSWVPSHGSTVIIRSVSCGYVITLLDGNVVLAFRGGPGFGSIHWACVESNGSFGFRSRVSNKFLCHQGGNATLECSAEERDSWRHFTITPVQNRGYIMQMPEWWTLRPIVISAEKGLQKLARTGNKLSEGIVWEFIKVE